MGDGIKNKNEAGFNKLVEKWFEYPNLFHEGFRQAAVWAKNEIDALRAKLALLEGATVVNYDPTEEYIMCPFHPRVHMTCNLTSSGCRDKEKPPSDCQIRNGNMVIVQMKKETK